jgi:outer membrane protein assembly factor BamB
MQDGCVRTAAYVGAWDGCIYAFDPVSGKLYWKSQVMDADTNTKAQVPTSDSTLLLVSNCRRNVRALSYAVRVYITWCNKDLHFLVFLVCLVWLQLTHYSPYQVRATPALSSDCRTLHFPAGRALYGIDTATGAVKYNILTKQVVYTSPTVTAGYGKGNETVVYGASGGGMANAVSADGKLIWSANLTQLASTMAASTTDGHVLLNSGNTPKCQTCSFLNKIDPTTGNIVWTSQLHDRNIQAAAITVDAAGTAWIPSGHGLIFTNTEGNSTMCSDIGGGNSMGSLTIPIDGVVLQLTQHGGLRALV